MYGICVCSVFAHTCNTCSYILNLFCVNQYNLLFRIIVNFIANLINTGAWILNIACRRIEKEKFACIIACMSLKLLNISYHNARHSHLINAE